MTDVWLAVSRENDEVDGDLTVHIVLTNLEDMIRAATLLEMHHPRTGEIRGPYVPDERWENNLGRPLERVTLQRIANTEGAIMNVRKDPFAGIAYRKKTVLRDCPSCGTPLVESLGVLVCPRVPLCIGPVL